MNIRQIALAGVIGLVSMRVAAQCAAPSAAQLQKDVAQYKAITVTVDDCVVQLNGSVERLKDAWDVEQKFRARPWAARVVNYLSIVGPMVDDGKLRKDVAAMVNFGDYSDLRAPLGIAVQRGVVTLNGIERDPMQLDSMPYAVASIKGVRAILSNVRVDSFLNVDELVEWTPRTTILWNQYVGPMYPREQQ
jgi:osmotically-inducible protein OsmY